MDPTKPVSSHTVRPHLASDPAACARTILAASDAAARGGGEPADVVKAAARFVNKAGQKTLQTLFGQLYCAPTSR